MDKWTCSNLQRIRLEGFGLNEELLHHNSKKGGAGEEFESPLGCKEIKVANPKGNQPWIFIGRTVAEAETPIL